MPKKDNRTMPTGYAACTHTDCTQGEHCLRRTAYADLSQTFDTLTVVNPERCTRTDECPYFRDNTPVRYARGFKGMQRKMYPDQYATFRNVLSSTFSLSGYYQRKRGDYGLSPHEQNIVKRALRKAGVEEDLNFDAYETQYDWED